MERTYPGGPLNQVPKHSHIGAMLEYVANRYQDKVFMRQPDGESITFADLRDGVDRVALGLLELDANPVAGILGDNGIGWAVAFLAVLRCGGIAVPIDRELPSPEVNTILHYAGAKVLFLSSRLSPAVSEHAGGHGRKIHRIALDGGDAGADAWDMEALARSGASSPLSLPEDPGLDSPAVISYTSGTMGQAKGVVLSARNLLSDLRGMLQAVGLRHDEVFLSVLPMHHMYECVCGFLCPLSHGCTVVICRGLRYIAEDLAAAGATLMLGVPLLWESMYRRVMEAWEF